jgi:hypothetical protein
MNKIQPVADFLNALKAKLSAPKSTEALESCPLSRLKQIESRSREVVESDLIDPLSMQRTTVREAAIRWSNNPGAFVKQQILAPHQMSGNKMSNFEIDPMSQFNGQD